jgi:RsiW-degrading membrane proteinase PrsW (M82 family)
MIALVLGTVLSIACALLPALLAAIVLWWLDRYEKEPLWLLSILLLWGAVPTVVLSFVAQAVLDIPLSALLGPSFLYHATQLSLVAPLTEETFKALIILAVFLFYRAEFDGVMDGILYGALVGLGFSVVEDVLYFLQSLQQGGWTAWGTTVLLRVGLYALNHALFGACTGVGFGVARSVRRKSGKAIFPLLGWTAAVGLHAIHNGGALLAESTSGLSCALGTFVDWIGVLGMLILIAVVTRAEGRWLRELASEVAAGTITPAEYEVASRYGVRMIRGWQVFTQDGLRAWLRWARYVQRIVDLGYKKHQLKGDGGGSETERQIADLRDQIAHARTQISATGG